MSAPGGTPIALPGAQAQQPRSGGPFSYSGDPATSDLDAVRFLVGDTNSGAYFLNDAEIAFLLSTSGNAGNADGTPNVIMAAGAAAEAIAAALSREVTYSADGVSISADTLAQKFYTVGEKLRTLSMRSDVAAGPDTGGIMVGEVYDDSIRPLVFSVGMHDNYAAGQQDFGGAYLPPAADYSSRAYLGIATYTASLVRTALSATTSANVLNNNVAGPAVEASATAP